MGARRIVALVVEMSDGKNREWDGASALSGRHLVKRRNNQLIVVVSSGGCIKEETRPGRNVQRDAVSSSLAASFLAYRHGSMPKVSCTSSYIETKICMTIF
jgi:hypothetical protein